MTREERRVAGGNRLTAKLKVRGSGLRPMLQASIDDVVRSASCSRIRTPPTSWSATCRRARTTLVLYDGVQEVARLANAVTIESAHSGRVAGIGTLINLDRATAESLTQGRLSPGGPEDAIVKLGAAHAGTDGRWQRDAEILLQCDPDPGGDGCAIGGQSLAATPLPIVRITGPAAALIPFALREVMPANPPEMITIRVRIIAPPEVLALVRPGDRDDCLDDRAATVIDIGARRVGARPRPPSDWVSTPRRPDGATAAPRSKPARRFRSRRTGMSGRERC